MRHRNGETHHHQSAGQVNRHQAGIEQLCNGRRAAKAVQHAGQRKVQDKSVQPRNGRLRQPAAPRRNVAAQHQCKEGKGDEENGEHGESEGLMSGLKRYEINSCLRSILLGWRLDTVVPVHALQDFCRMTNLKKRVRAF